MLRDISGRRAGEDAGSGAGGFTLVGVTSSDPGVAPTSPGWDVGTADTAGQVRAAIRRNERVYRIGYEVRDAAGNTAGCEGVVTAAKRP